MPLLLVTLEGVLRWGGYGYETALVVKDATGENFHENDKFLWRFFSPQTKLQPHPFLVPVRKEPDTLRIVVLGESAALGTPEPAYGFWRMLERQLRRDFPGRKFEVINAAMRGINSHVILPIAKECVRLQPDLFVIYMGNNEVVGLHAPGPETHLSNLTLLRAIDWVKGTRCGQLLLAAASKWVKTELAENQDMAFFRAHRLAADDPRRLAVYRNFESNLRDICTVVTNSGAHVLLCTIPVNLRDCAPLGSLHRAGFSTEDQAACDAEISKANGADGVKHLEAALARDDHYAEWHYRLAEMLSGDPARQLREYQLARDWDALQFRADAPINDAIRKTAAEMRLPLVDAEKKFAENLPGRELFYEHVHLRFAGDHLLAQNIYPAVIAELGLKPGSNVPPVFTSREELAQRLGFTSLNEFQIEFSISQLLGTPPFLDQFEHATRLQAYRQAFTNKFILRTPADVQRDLDRYRSAIGEATNDWHLHVNLGDIYTTLQKPPPAIEQYQMANRLMPHYQPARLKLARAQARAGRAHEAQDTIEEGLKIDPKSPLLQAALSQVQGR